ncbi:MAG: HD domain-containing protein [Ruminococcaceae bacterium]|nr:HD domain-containing protein [Oscillospiraceae bacterium]
MFAQEAKQVLSALEAAGHQAYLVGGCVRDLLRGVAPHDIDITTSARPEEVLSLFDGFAIPTGLQHGTVTVREGGESFEVTTFRADGAYTDHRRPDSVTFSHSLEEDLRRRDFTVNAMAMDLRGTVYDFHGGADDLRAGIIRCVGEPAVRFEEDALRILRGLRFASVLGFAIEEETALAMARCAPLLGYIAHERICEEMTNLLMGDGAAEILVRYPRIFGVFLPEILPCVGFDQRNYHHLYDVWEHTARAVGNAPKDALLRWTMLLHDLGKPACFSVGEDGVGHFYGHDELGARMAADIARRLRFDKKTAARLELLIERHMRQIEPTEKAVGRVLRQIGEEAFRQLLAVKRADASACHPNYAWQTQTLDAVEAVLDGLLAQDACFTLRDLAVDGRDMMALGLRGREIGEALDALLTRVAEGELPNEKAALLEWVRARK